MIRKSDHGFSEEIMLKKETSPKRDGEAIAL